MGCQSICKLRFQTKLAYSDMRNNMSIMDYYNNMRHAGSSPVLGTRNSDF